MIKIIHPRTPTHTITITISLTRVECVCPSVLIKMIKALRCLHTNLGVGDDTTDGWLFQVEWPGQFAPPPPQCTPMSVRPSLWWPPFKSDYNQINRVIYLIIIMLACWLSGLGLLIPASAPTEGPEGPNPLKEHPLLPYVSSMCLSKRGCNERTDGVERQRPPKGHLHTNTRSWIYLSMNG